MAAPAVEAINHKLNEEPVAALEAVGGFEAGIPGQRIDEPDAAVVTAPEGVVKTSVFDKTPAEPVPGSSVGRYYKPGLGWVNGDNQPIAEPASRLNPAAAPAAVETADEQASAVSAETYNGLGRQLRVEGAVPMHEEDQFGPQASKGIAELRRELEEPGAVAFENAYAKVLAHHNITASDDVPAEVEAEAVKEGNKARAATEAGEEVMSPINRAQGTVYGTTPEQPAASGEDADEVGPSADEAVEDHAEAGVEEAVDAPAEPDVEDTGENHSDSAEVEDAAQEYVGRHRAENQDNSTEKGVRAWTRRRFSGAMRLAKWAYDRAGLPTKEDVRKTAAAGAMASAVLADQVQFEAKQLWRRELKPGLQSLVHDALGKACMYLDSEDKLGAKDIFEAGWQKYLERDARATQLRDEQAAVAEAARVQAFQDEAARSQAEWAQANLSR